VHPTRSAHYKWAVAGMAFFAVLGAIGFARFSYSAILPSMQEGLGITAAQAGSLTSWNLAGYTLMALIGGMLASRFGPRIVVTGGLAATALGMLLTGLSGDMVSASAARLLTGLGNGAALPPSIALMGAWFEPRRLGFASGIVPAGSSFAMVLVGPTVPHLIAAGGDDGWRFAWYVLAGVAAFLAVLTFAIYRDHPYDASIPRGTRVRARIDLRAIFRSRYAWHLGAIYLVYGFAFAIYFTFFQKRLVSDLDMSDQTAGFLFVLLGLGGTISPVIFGAVSDRVGRGRTIALAFLIQAVAALLFAFWPHVVVLALSGFLMGAGALCMPSLIGAACGDEFGAVAASASLGFVTIFIGVGQAAGPYVGGFLADTYSSLAPSYVLAGAVFAAGMIVALFLRDARPTCTPPDADPGALQAPAAPDPAAAVTTPGTAVD